MKEINKFIYKTVLFLLLSFSVQAQDMVLKIGVSDAKITVKVFSSLTCPHCASFHGEIFNNLKKDFIDKGLVKFEHHAFPLDLAALNASKLAHCENNGSSDFLHTLYKNQETWKKGNNILEINNNLKKACR